MSGAQRTVAVVTDSAASLPEAILASSGVVVVPMSLVLDGTVYPDGELSAAEVMAPSGDRPVTTSAPSPGEFLKVFERLSEPEVLIITVASQMSASFAAASTAAGYIGTERVRVLDSGTAAGAQGLVVQAAAAAAAGGGDLDTVARAAEAVARRVHLVAALESLVHLARSGRVPGLAAKAGRTLGVRPIFEFASGHARPRRPAFKPDAVLDRLVAAPAEDRQTGGLLHAAVLDAEADEQAAVLERRLCQAFPHADLYRAPFSSVMAAHTGPGLVGVAWWWQAAAA